MGNRTPIAEAAALSIETLQDEWAKHPLGKNRVLGGRRALGGFRFQMYVSLDRFFAEVLRGNRDAQFLFDGLSDIAHLQGDLVYLTQVKTTLDSDSLRSAIDEALALQHFLQEQQPKLIPKVVFQVVAKRSNVSKLPVISELTAGELKLEPSEAVRWESARPRFQPIIIQSNPRVDLAVRLWPHTNQCFVLVDSCLGRLFDLIGRNASAGEIVESLLEEWDKRRSTAVPPGKLLAPKDFTVIQGETIRIVQGILPGPKDLVDGCFMERPSVLQMALEKMREASARAQASSGGQQVLVFWISGPSGSGKSVLLLQLMRELVLSDDVTVVNYLGQLAHMIPRALSYWIGSSNRVLVAIDDLYAPENRDLQLWNEIAEVIFTTGSEQKPWVLTCGPTEQMKAFNQATSRHPQIRVVEIRIDPMDQQETVTYHRWYQSRTGVQVALSSEPIIVAATWIYELRRQADLSPETFAWKFNRRLQELGLQAQAQSALALNQFGLKAPDQLFWGCEMELDVLTKEQIYRLAQPTQGMRQGRFFHQQIAKIIYDVIVPKTEVRNRAEDLALGFEAMLEIPEAADAFMAWLNLPKTQSLLSQELKYETVAAMWSALANKGSRDDLIPRLKRWHQMAHATAVKLDSIGAKRQIREWFEAASEDELPWGLLFQMTWDDADQHELEPLYKRANLWLQTHFEAEAWNWIWQKLWGYHPKDRELTDLGYVWLYDHPESLGWTYVWQLIFDSGVRESDLLTTALQAMPFSPETLVDVRIWEKIETLQPEQTDFLAAIVRKLAHIKSSYFRDRGVEFVLSRAGQQHFQPYLLDVIAAVSSEPQWPYLWQTLVSIGGHDRELLKCGWDWLTGHEEKPEWNYMWQRLVELGFEKERLLPVGRDWLTGHEEKPEWSHVWERLVELGFEKERLLPVGRDWLAGRKSRADYPFVYKVLYGRWPQR